MRTIMVDAVKSSRPRFSVSPRTERFINVAGIGLAVVMLIVAVLWRIPSSYQLLLPATAESVESKIYVANYPAATGKGRLLMTFVLEDHANMLENIFERLNPDATFLPLQSNYSQSQEIQQGKVDMLSSTQIAEAVALCHVGYRQFCGGGVLVKEIESYSKAGTILKTGDVIVKVDASLIATPDQLRAALASRPAGSIFTVTVQRRDAKQQIKSVLLKVPSVQSTNKPYHTVLGIVIDSAPPLTLPSSWPRDIKIDPGNIGGPSAGLMFTLGVLNRLSPTDLTHGCTIAGTGTINLDGSVGPIGGVKQKVIGAQWAHARYFFIPQDIPNYAYNYSDAKKAVGRGMTLVPVTSLDDALNFLHGLKPSSCH